MVEGRDGGRGWSEGGMEREREKNENYNFVNIISEYLMKGHYLFKCNVRDKKKNEVNINHLLNLPKLLHLFISIKRE